MAEMRASSFGILVLIVGALGFVALTFFGVFAVGWFNSDWLKEKLRIGGSASRGYFPAKTPMEAMDRFRTAIQARHYDDAAIYTTKPYGDVLKRAHPACNQLAKTIDRITEFGKNKSYESDRTRFAFDTLDPFPKNFRTQSAPVEKDGKAYSSYTWEPLTYKNPNLAADTMWVNFEHKMYQNVLGGSKRKAFATGSVIELVKEGEHWKLNIPMDPGWETEISYYIENANRYHSNLEVMKGNMLNERYTSESYESDIISQLRASKQ